MAAPPTAVGLVLRAYPRPWRERYGAEMAALLAERQPGWWDLLDLVRGGLDARLHRLVRPPAQLVAAMPRREVVMAVPIPRPYGVVEKQPWYAPSEMLSRKPIVDGKMDIDFDSVVVDAPLGRSSPEIIR